MAKTVYGEILQLPSLTSLWRFNNNSNDELAANNGSDADMVYNLGKFSSYATFNGNSSRVALPNNASLKPTGDWTIGFWRRGGYGEGDMFALWQESGPDQGILFEEQISGSDPRIICFLVNTTNTDALVLGSLNNPNIFDGNWHFLTYTFTFSTKVLRAYVDGRLRSSLNSGFAPSFAAASKPSIGGRWANSIGNYFNFWAGDLEELFLLNGYVMSIGEIRRIYAQAKGLFI